uniref:Uncharacterized protein n=1 Tax=Tanacetum cinerariifolium TaxID=118510 RepID=A0A699I2C9_TANCI|nr:hypothetical protein [Tanacetum cinerariifolium]
MIVVDVVFRLLSRSCMYEGSFNKNKSLHVTKLINPLTLHADVAGYTRRNTSETSPLGGLYEWWRYASCY